MEILLILLICLMRGVIVVALAWACVMIFRLVVPYFEGKNASSDSAKSASFNPAKSASLNPTKSADSDSAKTASQRGDTPASTKPASTKPATPASANPAKPSRLKIWILKWWFWAILISFIWAAVIASHSKNGVLMAFWGDFLAMAIGIVMWIALKNMGLAFMRRCCLKKWLKKRRERRLRDIDI